MDGVKMCELSGHFDMKNSGQMQKSCWKSFIKGLSVHVRSVQRLLLLILTTKRTKSGCSEAHPTCLNLLHPLDHHTVSQHVIMGSFGTFCSGRFSMWHWKRSLLWKRNKTDGSGWVRASSTKTNLEFFNCWNQSELRNQVYKTLKYWAKVQTLWPTLNLLTLAKEPNWQF